MERPGSGAKRSYNQYCGLASALDILGERWTLLIIRELLMGPRRYSDLLVDLPGIGTNLLAERLKFLVDKGVVQQIDLKGTGSRLAYELAEPGESLRPIVLGLAHWGMDHVGDLSPADTVRPHWGFLAVEAMFQPEKASAIDESYEFRVDDQVFHVTVAGRVPRVGKGPADNPAMVAVTDAATFVQIGAGRLTPLIAMVSGRLTIEGDAEAVVRCCELLGIATGAMTAPSRAPSR
ncbi:winged helix-turn-helix transcriptional regulator [Micromonospora olivasterospora]|uniref:HxlR family transcriptional regulator n=1 Tax=Micromonospora olivasterospora TaxID=1880 RepID=A0A562I2B9_MICOL|nr:winged helix-turn-helix transcriptional regulator [Micromonospora olivasterospora]TWH65140.1 HxlR family transcriptional regulator [Micromonospora olivasterospora]